MIEREKESGKFLTVASATSLDSYYEELYRAMLRKPSESSPEIGSILTVPSELVEAPTLVAKEDGAYVKTRSGDLAKVYSWERSGLVRDTDGDTIATSHSHSTFTCSPTDLTGTEEEHILISFPKKNMETLGKWFPDINPESIIEDTEVFKEMPRWIINDALTILIADIIMERQDVNFNKKYFNGFIYPLRRMIERFHISKDDILLKLKKLASSETEYYKLKEFFERIMDKKIGD